jgi:cell wall-associated NlpC family hydrolase
VAKEYIGVRYRHGQSNAHGFDCSGYVKYIFRKFDFSLPHSSSAQYKQCRRVKFNEAQPGDLVFFVINGKHISHVGIYLGNHMFIHSPSYGKRVSIESLDGAYYKRRLLGFGSVL